MSDLQGRATRSEISDQRRAEFGLAAATILDQKKRELAKSIEIYAVDDRPAMPLADDQSSAREDRQMRRHGVLRNLDQPRQFSGGESVGFARDEQPECVEPRRLRESGEHDYGLRTIHISRLADSWLTRKTRVQKSNWARDRRTTPPSLVGQNGMSERRQNGLQ